MSRWANFGLLLAQRLGRTQELKKGVSMHRGLDSPLPHRSIAFGTLSIFVLCRGVMTMGGGGGE